MAPYKLTILVSLKSPEITNKINDENEHDYLFQRMIVVNNSIFSYLFLNGKFGYTATRNVSLLPVTYFNQRLLN